MLYESEYYGIQNIPAERYLEHHGILGQKWGVRRFQNADGSLTAAGKERYLSKIQKSNAKNVERGNYNFNDDDQGKQLRKAMDDAYEEYKKANKIAKDYWDDEELVKKYATKLAERDWPEAVSKYHWADTPESKARWIYMHIYEDFDQGYSFDLYAEDKGIDLDSYRKNVAKADRKYSDSVEKYVDHALGKYGERRVPDHSMWTYDANRKKIYSRESLKDRASRKLTNWNWG